jgi:hypothetical protein
MIRSAARRQNVESKARLQLRLAGTATVRIG